MSWTPWFVQLSGWQVVVTCAAITVLGMILLSIVMTRMTGASALRNMLIALEFLAFVTAALLALVAVMTRTSPRTPGGRDFSPANSRSKDPASTYLRPGSS